MKSEPFWRFDTAGNTTLLLNNRAALPYALSCVPAEQAGALEGPELFMAGGEFCANACLALAAWANLANSNLGQIIIAGQKVSFGCAGSFPEWQAWARFDAASWEVDKSRRNPVAHLPGISHVLVECENFPEPDAIGKKGRELLETHLPAKIAAKGVVWWRGREILPFVHVPDAGTCNIEGACGSGSIALALALGEGSHRISQPSSSVLDVEIKDRQVRLGGQVRLLASGELWQP